MEKEYIVKTINGDYAVLCDFDGGEIFISVFLLPENLLEGDRVTYSNLTYIKA